MLPGTAKNITNSTNTVRKSIVQNVNINNQFNGCLLYTSIGKIRDVIIQGFQDAIDWIKALPAQAVQWGADIIDGIVSGITSAVGKIGKAASNVASKIRSFLGFSEPEDGPLSDFHTYMPDKMCIRDRRNAPL